MSRTYPKTLDEIYRIRQSSEILSKVHGIIAQQVDVGVKTETLDQVAEAYIRHHGAIPSFKGYQGFSRRKRGNLLFATLPRGYLVP